MPEPWPEPVDGDDLLSEIIATIKRFVVYLDETAIAAALWIVMTWFVDVIQVAPLAVITAPEKRSGKSTLLEIFGLLCNRPLQCSNITPSALFRTIEDYKPTLLIDEMDTFARDNDELRGVLNSGHMTDIYQNERKAAVSPKVKLIYMLPATSDFSEIQKQCFIVAGLWRYRINHVSETNPISGTCREALPKPMFPK